MKAGWTTWWLNPRDPLVFRRGGSTPAYLPTLASLFPTQAATAGLVRSTLVGGGTSVSPSEAAKLLEVAIRGPWLVDRTAGAKGLWVLWVPVPGDLVLAGQGGSTRALRATLEAPRRGEGVSRAPLGTDLPPLLTVLPSHSQGESGEKVEKTRRPRFPYRPLEWVIEWSLGDEKERAWPLPGPDGRGTEKPIEREARVHVGIDDDSLTAQPEALFGSVGLRFREGFELAVEVADRRTHPPNGSPSEARLLILGGESRVSTLSTAEGAVFPAFETWRPRIEKRVEDLASRSRETGTALGLRLQLLAPASFGGWRPREWPEPLGKLPLAAVAISGFEAVSGWDLQRRRPRAVRRLVPAGSVYTFGPIGSSEALLELCEALWGRSLCAGLEGDPESFLAPPEHDGYGTVLPLPCALPKEVPSP